MTRPQCVVIAGPNGAGKTSAAPELLKDAVGVAAFVNADVIAEGLAGFRPEAVSVDAGRAAIGGSRSGARPEACCAWWARCARDRDSSALRAQPAEPTAVGQGRDDLADVRCECRWTIAADRVWRWHRAGVGGGFRSMDRDSPTP